MNSYERTRAAIEFTEPDRLPIAGDCMQYDTHGDVIYHHPQMSGTSWWLGGGGSDEWGCVWESVRDGDMGQIREHPLQDLARFAELPRPDGRDPARYANLEAELAKRPDAYHVFCNGPVVFERMHFLRGFDALLMDMMLDPDDFKAFGEWVVEYQLQTLDYLKEHFAGKIHGLRCTDDLGTQAGSIMSPDQFHKQLKPFYASVGERCREAGLHFWMHSCGRIDGILDDLIEAGLKVVNIQQPQIFDLAEMKKRFAGRICFEAYPDIQRSVPAGDREVVRQDIAAQLEHLTTPSGGYIAAWLSDHLIKADCDVDKPGFSDAITQTYRELDPYLEGK